MSISMSMHTSIHLSMHVSIRMSIHMSMHMSIRRYYMDINPYDSDLRIVRRAFDAWEEACIDMRVGMCVDMYTCVYTCA